MRRQISQHEMAQSSGDVSFFGCKGGSGKRYTCKIHTSKMSTDDRCIGSSLDFLLQLSLLFYLPRCLGARAGARLSGAAVYDIRLCISDSMMLIICLGATGTRSEGEGDKEARAGRAGTEREMDRE